MKHLSKITVTGVLLLTLASASYAQSSMTGNQDSTGNQQGPMGTTNAQSATDNSQQANQTNTQPQTSHNKNMPLTVTPDNIQWQDAPKSLPSGAQFAVLEGNLKNKGNFTMRIKLPSNYQLPPAYVQNPIRVTVLSGSVNLGIGDKVDATSGINLPAGSFVMLPAKKHHYLSTTEDSVVQVSGTGPWVVKYVNAKDDPRKNKDATGQNPGQSQTAPTGQDSSQAPSSSTNSNGTMTPATSPATTPASTDPSSVNSQSPQS